MPDSSFCYSYPFVHSFSSSYYKLMVTRYGSKWEKFQVAKQRAADEQRPVRETKRVMDVELFLGLQEDWAEDSPHH